MARTHFYILGQGVVTGYVYMAALLSRSTAISRRDSGPVK